MIQKISRAMNKDHIVKLIIKKLIIKVNWVGWKIRYHYSSLLQVFLSLREFYLENYYTDINTHKLSSEVYGDIDLQYPV